MPFSRRSACSACSIQCFGNKKNHMPDARGACRAYDWGLVQSFPAPRKLLPPLRRSPSLEEGGLGEGNRAFVECRRARDARPYNVAGKCNCEMRLKRWVASLQRLDAFATVGCTAVHRRGAHCAPVYLRCYNNLSSGRAKGHRGDRKAPISNRRQGRRP